MREDREIKLDAVLKMRQEGRERSERYQINRKRFRSLTLDDLRSAIKPHWSYEASDLKYNLSNEKFFPQGYTLLRAPLKSVLSDMHDNNYFDQDVLFPVQRHDQKIIEILAEWESMLALTPPVVQCLEGRIAFNDGMHRFTVACLLQSNDIPMYVKREDEAWFLTLPGMQVIDSGEGPNQASATHDTSLPASDEHEQENA